MLVVFVLSFCCFIRPGVSIDRDRLSKTPWPQPGFDVERYAGDWFLHYFLPPCSWAGSRKFSNFISNYSPRPDGTIALQSAYRKGFCTSFTNMLQPGPLPGAFIMKDPIGDILSGPNIIVATDYRTFAVKWGCTKKGVHGDCDDYYVNVKTRHPEPNKYTLRAVEMILNKKFSLSLNEMVRFYQDAPCFEYAKASRQGPAFLGKK